MGTARRAGADWPRLLVPAPGYLSPTAPLRSDERVLHIALRNATDKQEGLDRALRSIASEYRDVSWTAYSPEVRGYAILDAAREIKPTLVFMQLHCPVLDAGGIRMLRDLCDPNVVIVNWDGDQHYQPHDIERQWFVEIGREERVASLVVNTRHPAEYAAMGVRHPGFLGVGIDQRVWCPVTPTPGTPEVVFLANFYQSWGSKYKQRLKIVTNMIRTWPNSFALYGVGWESVMHGQCTRPFLSNHEEAGVYSGARAALSISICNDLERYTSNRLFYGLASGAIMLVEAFPDVEGLGVEDGRNAFLWRTWDDLAGLVQHTIGPWCASEEQRQMRRAARELGLLHSWDAHMPELLAIVDAVRAS